MDILRSFNVRASLLGLLLSVLRMLGITGFVQRFLDSWQMRTDFDGDRVFPYIEKSRGSTLLILAVHRVSDGGNPFNTGLPVGTFRRYLEELRAGWTVFRLEDAVLRLQACELPPKSAAITFDDGYRDNYELAFPLLKAYELPATIFITTSTVDSDRLLWHDKAWSAFCRTRARQVRIDGCTYSLDSAAERERALFAFRQLLRRQPFDDWDAAITRLCGDLACDTEGITHGFEKLRWTEIEEMARDNISFGAHTHTHPLLTSIPLDRAREEILLSKRILEERLTMPVTLFAYPNGSHRDFHIEIKESLQEMGFLCAVTTIHGVNTSATDPFQLRRVMLRDKDPGGTMLRLSWYRFLHSASPDNS